MEARRNSTISRLRDSIVVFLLSVGWFLILPLQFEKRMSYCASNVCTHGYDFTFLNAHPWRWLGGYHVLAQYLRPMHLKQSLGYLDNYSVAHPWEVAALLVVSFWLGGISAMCLERAITQAVRPKP